MKAKQMKQWINRVKTSADYMRLRERRFKLAITILRNEVFVSSIHQNDELNWLDNVDYIKACFMTYGLPFSDNTIKKFVARNWCRYYNFSSSPSLESQGYKRVVNRA